LEESTVTVKVNDETIKYEIGETLTKVGKYTVTVTDECGNESAYEFEIIKAKKPVNVGLIIAFVTRVSCVFYLTGGRYLYGRRM